MITITIEPNEEALREWIRKAKKRVGAVMLEQVQRRIEDGGDDEEKFNPLDFPRPDGSQDHPLYKSGTHLLDSLDYGFNDKEAWVGTNFIGARIQNFGTTGKGGKLPSI